MAKTEVMNLADDKDIDFYLMDLASRFPKDLENYYLSYSGGRDSHFLLWFIKDYLHDEKCTIVGINTYMEHREIMRRMRRHCDIILKSDLKPFEIKEQFGSPCFSKTQDQFIDRWQRGVRTPSTVSHFMDKDKDGQSWRGFGVSKKARELELSGKLHRVSDKCCYYLKKRPAHQYEKQSHKHRILATRGDESKQRKTAYVSCFSKDGSFHPLYDLSDEMLRAIEKRYDIEVPSIYEYVKRTGCMGCPYGSWKHDTEKELRLVTKNQRKFLGELFGESYKVLGIDIEAIKRECGDYDELEAINI